MLPLTDRGDSDQIVINYILVTRDRAGDATPTTTLLKSPTTRADRERAVLLDDRNTRPIRVVGQARRTDRGVNPGVGMVDRFRCRYEIDDL